MNRQNYLDQAIFGNDDGQNFFFRASFQLPYVGLNSFGQHNDVITISIYERFANENVNCTRYDEALLKVILEPQIRADRLPSSYLIDPDYYRDLYHQGNVTHSLYIWDAKIEDLEINLNPVYSLQKAIFVLARTTETEKVHELHCLVHCIPL